MTSSSGEEEEEEELNTNPRQDFHNISNNKYFGSETSALLARAKSFSSKVQVRTYAHALKKLSGVKLRAADAVKTMQPHVVNLFEYANKELDYLCDDDNEEDVDETSHTVYLADYLPSTARRVAAPIARVVRFLIISMLAVAFPAKQSETFPAATNDITLTPAVKFVNGSDGNLSYDLYQHPASDDDVLSYNPQDSFHSEPDGHADTADGIRDCGNGDDQASFVDVETSNTITDEDGRPEQSNVFTE
jgi:hypothetical protein